MKEKGSKAMVETLKKGCMSPDVLRLKKEQRLCLQKIVQKMVL